MFNKLPQTAWQHIILMLINTKNSIEVFLSAQKQWSLNTYIQYTLRCNHYTKQ